MITLLVCRRKPFSLTGTFAGVKKDRDRRYGGSRLHDSTSTREEDAFITDRVISRRRVRCQGSGSLGKSTEQQGSREQRTARVRRSLDREAIKTEANRERVQGREKTREGRRKERGRESARHPVSRSPRRVPLHFGPLMCVTGPRSDVARALLGAGATDLFLLGQLGER